MQGQYYAAVRFRHSVLCRSSFVEGVEECGGVSSSCGVSASEALASAEADDDCQMLQFFRSLDRDGDGRISLADLKAHLLHTTSCYTLLLATALLRATALLLATPLLLATHHYLLHHYYVLHHYYLLHTTHYYWLHTTTCYTLYCCCLLLVACCYTLLATDYYHAFLLPATCCWLTTVHSLLAPCYLLGGSVSWRHRRNGGKVHQLTPHTHHFSTTQTVQVSLLSPLEDISHSPPHRVCVPSPMASTSPSKWRRRAKKVNTDTCS